MTADSPESYPTPEEEGLPDYADDDSTAYEEADRPRFRDSPANLPADEPQGMDEYGVTAAEQRHGESLDMLLEREEPDYGEGRPPEAFEGETGRLVEPDEGAHTDQEKDALAGRAGGEGLTAEEAAMHDVSEEEAFRGDVPGDEVIPDEAYEQRAYEDWRAPEEESGRGEEEYGGGEEEYGEGKEEYGEGEEEYGEEGYGTEERG